MEENLKKKYQKILRKFFKIQKLKVGVTKSKVESLVLENDYFRMLAEDFKNSVEKETKSNYSNQEVVDFLFYTMLSYPIIEILFENTVLESNGLNKILKELLEEFDIIDSEDYLELQDFLESIISKGLVYSDKQELIDMFFQSFYNDLLKTIQKSLGIVYTPIEVINFMIASTIEITKLEHNKNLWDENVEVIDPFTGNGGFVVQLLNPENSFYPEDKLDALYDNIRANEITLLSFWIAGLNIEGMYYQVSGQYKKCEGLRRADTFQDFEDM